MREWRRLPLWDMEFLEFMPWWAWIAAAAVAAVVLLPRLPGPKGLLTLAVLVSVSMLAAGDAAERFFPQAADLKPEFALAAGSGLLLLVGMAVAKMWVRVVFLGLSALALGALGAAAWFRFHAQ